ncbi:MAG: hypothetical protein KC457_22865 [Myxococcales bacterium]|nr:hypothetical protein [Myxococcales bacterium]
MHTRTIARTILLLALSCLPLVGCFKIEDDGGGDELAATDETSACPVSTENCPCTPGGGCDPGLECVDTMCVPVGGESSTDTTAGTTDTTTESSTDTTDTTTTEPSTDTTTTTGDSCGNGMVDENEQCDGNDLGGYDCVDLGYVGGTLACDPTSCTFDVSGCLTEAVCGNGIKEPGEQCDGDDLGGFDCVDLGYDGGELLCHPMNCTFVAVQCYNGPPP